MPNCRAGTLTGLKGYLIELTALLSIPVGVDVALSGDARAIGLPLTPLVDRMGELVNASAEQFPRCFTGGRALAPLAACAFTHTQPFRGWRGARIHVAV